MVASEGCLAQRVLIVDDEPDIVVAVEFALQREGFRTITAVNGMQALHLAQAERPDIVLLDLMLPDIPGTEVYRRMRAQASTSTIPVVMVTARGDEVDRVVGLELGADDYVVKPFSTRELVLRVRAVLRRAPIEQGPVDLEVGPVRVAPTQHRVWVGSEEVELTAMEFKLLHTLIQRKERVQSRSQLLEEVWDITAAIETRTVDTHVKRLRRKLGSAGDLIQTVRGVGYRLVVPRDG